MSQSSVLIAVVTKCRDTLPLTLLSISQQTYDNIYVKILMDRRHEFNDVMELSLSALEFNGMGYDIEYGKGRIESICEALSLKYDYIYIADDDAFLEKDVIEKLVKFMEEHCEAGYVMPNVLYPGREVFPPWVRALLKVELHRLSNMTKDELQNFVRSVSPRYRDLVTCFKDKRLSDMVVEIYWGGNLSLLRRIAISKELIANLSKWSDGAECEDLYLTRQIVLGGWKGYTLLGARVWHLWRGHSVEGAFSKLSEEDVDEIWLGRIPDKVKKVGLK
ncbi:MAG: glycosyltransferase [Thermofilum sp.]